MPVNIVNQINWNETGGTCVGNSHILVINLKARNCFADLAVNADWIRLV